MRPKPSIPKEKQHDGVGAMQDANSIAWTPRSSGRTVFRRGERTLVQQCRLSSFALKLMHRQWCSAARPAVPAVPSLAQRRARLRFPAESIADLP
jgi:hypothetical protein